MWFNNFYKNNIIYDILIRKSFLIEVKEIKDLLNLEGILFINFVNLKNKDELSFNLINFLEEISSNQKVRFTKKKGVSNKKIYFFEIKLKQEKLNNFLDFFLNIILKALRRRFITLNFNVNSNGLLNLNFSSLSELEIEEFFYFLMDGFKGSLNIKISFPKFLKIYFSYFFIKIFNLSNIKRF